MREIVLLFLLLVSACARPDRVPLPLPSEGELLQRLSLVSNAYHSLDGEAKIGVTVDGKYVSSQQFLLLEKPNRFRTDVLSTFGQLILQLAVNRDDLNVFLNTTVPGTFYQGIASDENLMRFTRLPVQFEELVRLLLYDLPQISAQKTQAGLHELGAQLELFGDERRQVIVFDRALRPIESRYYQQGVLWLRVVYDKFSDRDGYPQKILIELPEQKTSAAIRFSHIRTNTTIPAERFVIHPPTNALVENLPY